MTSPTSGTTVHTQIIDCQVSSGELDGAINSLKGALASADVPVQLLSDWGALQNLQSGAHTPLTLGLDAAATLVAGCSHIHINSDAAAIRTITRDIRTIKEGPGRTPGANDIRFDGIGDLTLRMTRSDLIARGYTNYGNLYEGITGGCVSYGKTGQPSASVDSKTGKIIAIEPGGPGARTYVGNIHVGSTLAQVRAAFAGYDIEEILNGDFGQGSNGVIVNGSKGSIALGLESVDSSAYASGAAKVDYLPGVGVAGQAPTMSETGC